MTAQEERRKRPDLLTLVAIRRFVNAALGLLGACAIVIFAMLPVVFVVDDPVALPVSLLFLSIGVLVAAALGVISAVVGVGLLQMRPWARWAEIVLSILSLPSFPIGTALSVLVLIYLFGDEGKATFEGE